MHNFHNCTEGNQASLTSIAEDAVQESQVT